MNIEPAPFLVFVLVTSFTPGPNNISSASMGILHGFKSSLPYQAGIAAGFFCIMLICAFVSSTILTYLPVAEPVLRMAGAAYILWLAYGCARASYAFDPAQHPPMGFKRGFFLQTFNPKVAVYGLTLYSTFLAAESDNLLVLTLFAGFFATTAFCATSAWALCGAVIRGQLRRPKVRGVINAALVLLLIYCAYDLSGAKDLLP
jgi:cysteine/O-acetylserine efflux protein